MKDTLIAFITAYQSDSTHPPLQIRSNHGTALEINEDGVDKVRYYATPNGYPGVFTIADGVGMFLGVK